MMDPAKQAAAADLPSGPVMFLAEVMAEAVGDQTTVQNERNGVWWISGGCTPQSAGCKLNLRDVAEAVLVNLPDCGYGPADALNSELLEALKLAHSLCASTAPKQAVGEVLATAIERAEAGR